MTKDTNSLQKLDEAFFTKFNSLKKYKKGQIIIEPGTKLTGVYYLKSGFVRFFIISKEGKELTFNIFKPGSYFPMTWALTGSENIYFYECLTDAEITKAPKEDVIAFLKQNPEYLYDLAKRTLSGLEGLTKLMDALLSKNAYHQVCAIILMLAKRFGEERNKNISVALPLTHRLLGTLAGLSREATSRELEKLVKENIIEHNNQKLLIKNIKKLEEEFTEYSSENIIF
jgi:CRP/FNR family transcriptional regulator